jgi:hypothetical protein
LIVVNVSETFLSFTTDGSTHPTSPLFADVFARYSPVSPPAGTPDPAPATISQTADDSDGICPTVPISDLYQLDPL